jgi:hypothetical protein
MHTARILHDYCYMYSDWLRTGRPKVRSLSLSRVKNFLFPTSSQLALRCTQPSIQCIPEALSPGVKRPGREADHSPPTSAEVKKIWIYTSTSTYAFMSLCLISYAQEQLYLFTVPVYVSLLRFNFRNHLEVQLNLYVDLYLMNVLTDSRETSCKAFFTLKHV